MQALEFAVKLLRAIWGAVGGVITLYGLYFLLVPLTLVGGIALLGIAAILLLLVVLKQRIRISMLVAAVVIAAACTLAAPLAIPGRIYVTRCEQVSFDCVLTKQVSLGEASATIFPVADPIKRFALETISRTRPRFRILPTTRTPEGLYLVHAPMERVLADLSVAPEARASLATIELPGVLSDISTSLFYDSETGQIRQEMDVAAGFSPSAYFFVVGRYATSPGFFGARSQHPAGFEQWREAATGDLMLDALLRQDIESLDRTLVTPDPNESRRAALRRDLLHFQLNPESLNGTVFDLQTLMESRLILADHRETIDALTPDDPVYISAMQLIAWPLFSSPGGDVSEMEKTIFRAQYDYYRELFAWEYSWATTALPRAVSTQRLNERLDEVDEQRERQRLEDFLESREFDENDPADQAELLGGFARIMFGDLDETNEERELAELFAAENYEEINRRIGAAAPEERARMLWWLMSVMEREVLQLVMDAMIAVQGDPARASEAPSLPIPQWQEFVHTWSQHEAPLVREALDTRAEKLTIMLTLWEAMRRMFAVAAQYPDTSSPSPEAMQAIEQEVSRFGEAIQDRWLLPMLMEIAPSFEQSRAEQLTVLQTAIVRRCEAEDASAVQLTMLGYLLLDSAARVGGAQLDRPVLDCMWSTFGREGSHPDFWTGVAVTRGLMLVAHDSRILEINRDLLAYVGGDPPWMLYMLSRMGRSQEALSQDLGPGAENWERLVARYAPPAR
jgi:hypothetical protein